MLDELEQQYSSLKTKVHDCGSIFDAGKLREQLAEIEKQASDPGLWSNPEKSQQVMRERKRLENVLTLEGELVRRTDDIGAYFDLGRRRGR